MQWEDEETIHSFKELLNKLKDNPGRWAVVGQGAGLLSTLSERWKIIEGIETRTRPAKFGGMFRTDLLVRWVGKERKKK